MTTFTSYISSNYPALKSSLENNLSKTSRELLKEAVRNFAETRANEKISKYNQVMNGQEE